jgi:Cu/Ag efflux protein CusF
MTRRGSILFLIPVCLGMIVATGCKAKQQPRQYKFRGVVVRLDPGSNVATIRNEKVDGWMDAMTMEYPIENAGEYKLLHPGDNIEATVNVTSDGYWLSGVRKRQGD